MRYPASEKLEIIRIVEQSHLPAKRTLDQLGIPRRTFYRWYDRYLEGGPEALEDRPSAPSRVWNRLGEDIQDQIVEMALEATELSPRELAVRFSGLKPSKRRWTRIVPLLLLPTAAPRCSRRWQDLGMRCGRRCRPPGSKMAGLYSAILPALVMAWS